MITSAPFSSRPTLARATSMLVTLLVAGIARAQTAPAEMTTHTFKTVDRLEIKADVYRPPGTGGLRPAVLWIHGGALIMGDRKGMRGSLRDMLLEAGFVVVSIDYRLAPEVKLPAIYDDIKDAYAWLRKEGPRRFRIDAGKIVVMGGSAGGFLTLSAGFLFEPRPRGLVAFYGYGDVAAKWDSRPDPFYLKRPRVSKADAHAEVGQGVLTSSRGKRERGKFYLYCRQNGLWPKEVTGHDPDRDPKAFDAFSPARNVTKSYPPTLLIHGDRDTDVPFSQSEQMEKELQRAGVEHEFIRVLGAGHGLSGISAEEREKIHRRVVEFAKQRTKLASGGAQQILKEQK